jgi:glutamine amidotransferase
MQWNRLDVVSPGCPLLEGLSHPTWVYFVHSYTAPLGPDVIATCDYGGRVAAVVGRGRTWATQFHPEKSGSAGLALLANFAAIVQRSTAAA